MSKRRILPKAQVTYNLVTNNELPDTHWKGATKPSPRKEYAKKVNSDVHRDFNILSNKYWEGNEEKDLKDKVETKKAIDEKYKQSHDFNYLTCNYYDQAKQDQFLLERKEKQQAHGKDYLNRLPPTLRMRETIVFDASKGVPEEVKRFDEFRKNQKKRFEKRYELEQEYRDRDIEQQDRSESMAVNKYHGDKYYEEKYKGFDNFTLSQTTDQIKSLESHAKNKPKLGMWGHIQNEAHESLPERIGTVPEVRHDPVVNKVVNVDLIPLYTRENAVDSLPNQKLQTKEPEIISQSTVPQYEILQTQSLIEPQAAIQDRRDQSTPKSGILPFDSNTYQQQQITQQAGLMGEKTSQGMSQGLFESNVVAAPMRLYQPELVRDTALYRQEEYPTRGGSLANGNSNHKGSRLTSGASSHSRLSFTSEYAKSSDKLPSVSRGGMHITETGYNVPLHKVQTRQHKDKSNSKALGYRRLVLVEGGFAPAQV